VAQHLPTDIKGNTHVFNLLFGHITPKGSTFGFVDGVSILNSLGEFKPKLLHSLVVSSTSVLKQRDNQVPLLVDPAHPPVKSWFVSDLHGQHKLSNLEGVQLFADNFCKELLPSFHSQHSFHPCMDWEMIFLPLTILIRSVQDSHIGILL